MGEQFYMSMHPEPPVDVGGVDVDCVSSNLQPSRDLLHRFPLEQ